MALGRGRKAMVAAALALAVVGGAAWVTDGDSPDRRPDLVLVRVDDDTDTVQVFGLDGALQRTVQLPEGTVDDRVDQGDPEPQQVLVFWDRETQLLTSVDPVTGVIRTLELPQVSDTTLAQATPGGLLLLSDVIRQVVVVVDTGSMNIVEPPDGVAEWRSSANPHQIDGSVLIATDEPLGMVVIPIGHVADAWFAPGVIVGFSSQGAVSSNLDGDAVRLFTADGPVGDPVVLPEGNALQPDRWEGDVFLAVVAANHSIWRMDFESGQAVLLNDRLPGPPTLLPHERFSVTKLADQTVELYDLSGRLIAAFNPDSVPTGFIPSIPYGSGSDCLLVSLSSRAPGQQSSTVIVELETGKVSAVLSGEVRWVSPDGCSVATSEPGGVRVFHDGSTTHLGWDVELEAELRWVVDFTDDADFLVDLSTGKRTELPPGEGSYLFVAPATVEAQNAT
ncbi:MAG: hypothetical protein ABMA25_14860 [Ilumatobacteraceae bacterium]